MQELFDFLNQQSGNRLIGYGILFLLTVFAVTSMFEGIFKAIFSHRKFKNEEKNARPKEGEIKP